MQAADASQSRDPVGTQEHDQHRLILGTHGILKRGLLCVTDAAVL